MKNGSLWLLAHLKKMEISEYHLLANFTHMTGEIERIRESHTKLTHVESKLSYLETLESEVTERSFEWFKRRGMLINRSDGSRNIAFKVETFVNILSTIYDGIMELLSEIEDVCDKLK